MWQQLDFRNRCPPGRLRRPLCGVRFYGRCFPKGHSAEQHQDPGVGRTGCVFHTVRVYRYIQEDRTIDPQVSVMVAAAGLSCVAVLFISGYACLTLTYGEEDEDVFRHHDSPQVTFVLHRMVKGANATILLTCTISLTLSSLIAYVGCRSLPCCGCYDARTGLETLVPQYDPGDTELVCTWQAGSDDRLFNSPAQSTKHGITEEEEGPSKQPPYSRLT
ncbi:hypothetical protein F2P81_007540 [Scophthalmus maximus]|uniref:Uncharacterized protein n=1 Tax=Scophthalmus maximus TaxID=52904 RepID=A0A6A4T2I1_SCOMX|nr:hypothetical protein F2P81_007540 [Scophthalmus maximus]